MNEMHLNKMNNELPTWDLSEIYKNIKDPKIKDELKDLTNIAFQKDIFGAPTFVINHNLFWGQDRLEYALDELNN